MKILILGLGASGGGAEAAEYYLKLGHSVEIISPQEKADNDPAIQHLSKKGAGFIAKEEALKAAADADLVVKVPGIPIPYMIKKKAKRITNDIAALLENPKTERMTRIIIAGSKGKTSTASALASALNKLGISAAFSEGLGYSAFHLLSDIENEERTYDAIVIEMSLWQIKDTSASLGHNWPRIDILGITDNIPISLSPTDMSAEGSLFIGPWIRKIIAPRILWEKLMISGIVRRRSVKMYPSPINPFRNKPGMELGWECLRAIGFRRKDAKNAFSGYKGIPNRMEFIAVDNGISFINDSSSVLPISVAFSLRGMMGFPLTLNTITLPDFSAWGAFPLMMSMITSSFSALCSAQYFSSLTICSSKAHISSSSPITLMTLPRATMRSLGYSALMSCMLALFTP